MPTIEVAPLPNVGAEVRGVDLADLPDATLAELRDAFATHGLLFFRDQELTEDDHLALARRWGTINTNRFFAAHPDHAEIATVSKEPDDAANIGGAWHTDHSYDPEPALGSILVARELPESGGDTLFASMYSAYDTLDTQTKNLIGGLSARHSARHVFGSQAYRYDGGGTEYDGRVGNATAADLLTDVVHPMVIVHPLSGRCALFVNPVFTIGIEGMDLDQAGPLLERLYAHAIQDERVERFRWTTGSVAFWDNRAVWHNAINDYHGQRRVMHRVTLEGCGLSGLN